MSSDQIASLIYFSLLLVAIGGWVFVKNRSSLGNLAQMAALWGLIFLGAIAAFGLWDDIRRSTLPRQTVIADRAIELPRAPDGHFYAVMKLNGESVRFMVDTGATQLVLTQADAGRVGLDPENLPYLGRSETANGQIRTAYSTVDVITFGPFRDEGVDVSITRSDLDISLLGMRYLELFDSVEIRQDRLILSR